MTCVSATWVRWIAFLALCVTVAPEPARADDWGARRDPFDAGVVRRYKQLLVRDPHDRSALDALTSLYRRHRSLETLEAEYQAELAAGDAWAPLVVLARLRTGSRDVALELWNRALKVRPDDARGWIALGDLSTDAVVARDAYRRAASLSPSPRDRKPVLVKLVRAARSARDFATLDATYLELIALSPRDGGLWLERGDAQLATGLPALAAASFATAESLLKQDPERQLTAMTSQGLALERMKRIDEAIAQYERTLDRMPRGYHLGGELVQRVIAAERGRKRLDAALARLEARWPERTRGHFEWSTLGDLHAERKDDARALAAYRRAVDKAPTEIGTQRKLIALLDRLHPEQALAQHERAARIAPGDADLQITLAKRYHPIDKATALETLGRLARRFASVVNVRTAIAELYVRWEEPARAIGEYEAIAALEPQEPDHLIVLGEAYWRAKQEAKALAAWRKLDALGTHTASLRHGDVLALHDRWQDAVAAYSRALELAPTNTEAWRGRARAHDVLQQHAQAIDDARHAVALIGHSSSDNGHRERQLLVRVLAHWYEATKAPEVARVLARWRFAFEHGDIGAGYLLAAHHDRLGSPMHHDVLVALYRRVPTDDSLGLELARSCRLRGEFDRARTLLEDIGRRTPALADEVRQLLAQLVTARAQLEDELRWAEQGASATERTRARALGRGPDLVGRRRRTGSRILVGTDVGDRAAAIYGLGLYRTWGLAEGRALAARYDSFEREAVMDRVDTQSLAVGLEQRVLDGRKLEVAVAVAPRFELRLGYEPDRSRYDRVALGMDLGVQLLPRALPLNLGVRLQQAVTDRPRTSTLLLELAIEIR